MRPAARVLAAFFAAAAMAATAGAAHAQDERPGRILGRVVDHEDGKPLAGARVAIRESDAVALTDAQGAFTLTNVPAGLQIIEAELLGYEVRVARIRVVSQETIETEIRLSTEPINLPPIEVSVRSGRLEGAGFYDRRADFGTRGRFITRDEIENRRPQVLTDMLYNQPGLKVEYVSAGRRRVFVNRGDFCTPMLWVDGVLADNSDFDFIRPETIEGIEIYVGANLPLEFHRGVSGCGAAIVVWTQRGRR